MPGPTGGNPRGPSRIRRLPLDLPALDLDHEDRAERIVDPARRVEKAPAVGRGLHLERRVRRIVELVDGGDLVLEVREAEVAELAVALSNALSRSGPKAV